MSADATTEITDRRQLIVGHVNWTVTEFNHGKRYMLIATTNNGSAQFSVHFDAGEWAEFQKLVSP